LHASDTLKVLAQDDDDETPGPAFVSSDGVVDSFALIPADVLIPLRGESADDVSLLVKWLTRAKGHAERAKTII
jgi:hypothetical protein